MTTPQQIGFVGLGKMGFPMAGRLAAAGFALKVYDVDRRVKEQFTASFSSGFSMDLMLKDLGTAVNLARELEVPAIFSNSCRELWAAAQSSLGRGLDHTDVARWFEQLAHARLGE